MAHQPYVLSERAAQQVEDFLFDIAEYSGEERSRGVEHLLYTAFASLVAQPGLGHLRPDLLPAPVYFFLASPYQILYRKNIPIEIVSIIHGARDIAALMES